MKSLFRVDKKVERRVEPRKQVPVKIVEASKSGSTLTVEFDQAVALSRDLTPQYSTDVAGATPVSAELTTPTTLTLTYSESIAAATQVNIPFEEPAIRNAVGGFVADSTFPLAA